MSFTWNLFTREAIGCLPELFLLIACLAELMFTLFSTTQTTYPLEARPVTRRVALYLLVRVGLMLWCPAYQAAATTGWVFWAESLQLNQALVYTKVVVALLAALILLTSQPYLIRYRLNNYEFGVLVGLVVVAMFIVISAYHLLVLYLALELQAMLFFILLAWRRRSGWTLDATIKYLLVNLVASVFFLIALNQTFALVGGVSYTRIINHYLPLLNGSLPTRTEGLSLAALWAQYAMLTRVEFYPALLGDSLSGVAAFLRGEWLIVLALILAFSLKLGVAPFHYWVPAVYRRGVVPVLNLLTTASKIRYAAALRVLLGYVFYPLHRGWQGVLLALALPSVLVGNLRLVGQTQLLRILGLSSVARGGYFYLICAFAPSLYFYPLAVGYMVLSAILTLPFFLVMRTVLRAKRSRALTAVEETWIHGGIRYVSDLAALRHSTGHRGWSWALVLSCLAWMGVPPFIGFWSKFLTYQTVMHDLQLGGPDLNVGVLVYLGAVMVCTLIGALTYLRILSAVMFEAPRHLVSYLPSTWSEGVATWLLVGLQLVILWYPVDTLLAELTPYYPSTTGFMWF